MDNVSNKKLKYEELSKTLKINLLNGYSVMSIYKETGDRNNEYSATLYIKDNTVDMLDMMDEYENIKFTTNNINSTILKFVANENINGNFTKYVNRYKKMMDVLDEAM